MDTHTVKFAILYALMILVPAQADQRSFNDGPKSFYTIAAGTCTGCKQRDFSSTHPFTGLSDAVGPVAFSVQSWGNFNNPAYVWVSVGGTLITPSNATCNPPNCNFFENGSDSGYGPAPNKRVVTVPASTWNAWLGSSGSTMTIRVTSTSAVYSAPIQTRSLALY